MSPFAIILFALIAVPLVEIYLLISVGRVIGAGTTIAVVILTAVAGAWLLRIQGLSTLMKIQHSTAAGKLPAQELIEGLILLITGALLLTPGFFTDAIGFALLVPPIRAWCARRLLASGIYQAQAQVNSRYGTSQRNARSTHIFEGEYYETGEGQTNNDKRLDEDRDN